MCFGGDVGVYPHGDNVRELEMMVEYGMKPLDVLKTATSGNAATFHLDDRIGVIKKECWPTLWALKETQLEKLVLLERSNLS